MKAKADDLSAAVDALGKIMSAMAGRRLLARGIRNDVIRAKLESEALADEQIEKVAADGFEAGVMALAAIGYPGTTVHVCNPTDGEP